MEQAVGEPPYEKTPEQHREKPQVRHPVGKTPKEDIPFETRRMEEEKKIIDCSEDEARNDEPLELFPHKREKGCPAIQFITLVRKDITTYQSNSFNTESADKMAQPPVKIVRLQPLWHRPAPSINAERMVHYQEEDDQRADDRNLV